MCSSDLKLKAEKVITVLNKFERCRSGDNLVEIPQEKMKEIEGVKKYLLESKIDQYNKNNEFITIKFPKMLESTRKYTEFRKKLICGGL